MSPSYSPCWSSGNHSQRLFQIAIRGFDCKVNGWGRAQAQPGWLGWASTNTWCFLQSLLAATGSLEETVLSLSRNVLSFSVKMDLMLSTMYIYCCDNSLFLQEMKFLMGLTRPCYQSKPHSSLCSIFPSFIDL